MPTTRIVDDKSRRFTRSNNGWHVQRTGWARRSLWTGVRRDSASRSATWSATTVPGWYDVFVRFPRKNATTRQARYRIITVDGTRTRKIDQRWWSANRPGTWIRLGTYRFGDVAEVKLNDRTGERRSSGRRVVFDAVRFVPSTGPAGAAAGTEVRATNEHESTESKEPAREGKREVIRKPDPAREPEASPEPAREKDPEARPEPDKQPLPDQDRSQDGPPESGREPEPDPAEVEPRPGPEPTPEAGPQASPPA